MAVYIFFSIAFFLYSAFSCISFFYKENKTQFCLSYSSDHHSGTDALGAYKQPLDLMKG